MQKVLCYGCLILTVDVNVNSSRLTESWFNANIDGDIRMNEMLMSPHKIKSIVLLLLCPTFPIGFACFTSSSALLCMRFFSYIALYIFTRRGRQTEIDLCLCLCISLNEACESNRIGSDWFIANRFWIKIVAYHKLFGASVNQGKFSFILYVCMWPTG